MLAEVGLWSLFACSFGHEKVRGGRWHSPGPMLWMGRCPKQNGAPTYHTEKKEIGPASPGAVLGGGVSEQGCEADGVRDSDVRWATTPGRILIS